MPASWLPLTAVARERRADPVEGRDTVGGIVDRHDVRHRQVLGVETEHAVPCEADHAETGDGDVTYPSRIAPRARAGRRDADPDVVAGKVAFAGAVVRRFESDLALGLEREPVRVDGHALVVLAGLDHDGVAGRGGVHGGLDRLTGMNDVDG